MAKTIFSDDDLSLKFGGKAIIAVLVLLVIGLYIGLSSISSVSYAPALGSSTYSINSNIQPYPAPESGQGTAPAPEPPQAPIQEFVWIVYPLFFIAGYFVTVIARKFVKLSENDAALALSMAGALLVFISLLLLLNLSSFIQNLENNPLSNGGLYAWMYQFAIFAILGIALSFFGNRFNNGKTPMVALLSFVALPTVFLEAAFLLGIGVRDYFTYQIPNWSNIVPLTIVERFGWFGTFIFLGLLALLGYRRLRTLKNRNAMNAFARSLKIAGWIFCGVGLALFVFIVMQTNFATLNLGSFLNKIAEPVSYAIIGGAWLVIFGRLKK